MKNYIREYRQLSNMSQQKLADLCGVSMATIQAYERNKFQPRAETINIMLHLFDCDFQSLFQGDIIILSDCMPGQISFND